MNNVPGTIIKKYLKIPFSTRVLIWMLAGALAGIYFGEDILFIKPIGDIFLRLLIMAAIPLVFINLLFGISSLGDIKDFGKIGGKVLVWYVGSVLIAIIIGITVMSFSGAGKGMTLKGDIPEHMGEIPSMLDVVTGMVPSNIFASFAEGNLIQIVIFASLIGLVTLQLPEKQKSQLVKGYGLAATVLRKLVEMILKLSPLGLGALMAATFAEFGTGVLASLARFMLSIYTGHLLMAIIYMVMLKWLSGVSVKWFFSKTKQLYATTIATCSSLASLAVALDIAETKLGLPKKVFSFSLPMGAQFNKDGTAIMLAGILIFTSQAVGLEFSFAELIQVMLVGLLVVEGSGGIPGGGLVTAMLFAKAFQLPVEIVAIVSGIYRLIDMGNTTINAMGDMVVTTIVSKSDTDWEPKY